MLRGAGLAASVVTLALAACAQTPAAPIPSGEHLSLSALPGWREENSVAALRAVSSACAVNRTPDLADACADLAALRHPSAREARKYLEHDFYARPIGEDGLLTGYFMPVYPARRARVGEFIAPVRPRPADLPAADLSAGAHAPYASRAEIESRPAPDALAWMRPEDLFFMQIQGAGVLTFDDGARAKAVFAGTNGAPFVAIAAPMLRRGLLTNADASAAAIHAWLADHRGDAANALMALDPRYVFYRLAPDDGLDPFGSAGIRLVPGRSVAVDPNFIPEGRLLWIDADAPTLSGAFPAYRRLVTALDSGGAIRGPVRADLYVGRGAEAGAEAGRIRHTLTLYALEPR